MLEQALISLATAGGTALVQAAGTDAWNGLRQAVARWFARGDGERERAELERLDQTAAALQVADPGEQERARSFQLGSWQARIEAVLENLTDAERGEAAEHLRGLFAQHAPQGGVTAGSGGLAVGGNVINHADQGSVAAGVFHGGAQFGIPSKPDPSQG
ncbi:hypothetical protein KQY30_31425 [Streptomyces sp. GMY02]|uniref:hypothetical protein n=1 Tax=Streptomyces sp. GMY02 TaxID=1333528 RepID=UPI001C2C5AA8|nr:hypothetical protein [Streptomyces sp. GMY02]QXE38073.1 hypothetical protein KQY30_31425 [Streptomyces sp. GMY02]